MILPEAASFEQTAVVQVRLPQARKRRAIPSAAVLQEREECLALNPRCSHQVIDDVEPDFVIPGYDQRPCRTQLLQFYVTAPFDRRDGIRVVRKRKPAFPTERGLGVASCGTFKAKRNWNGECKRTRRH
jgi:hypothetical protein